MEQIQTAEMKSPVSKGVRAQQIAAAVLAALLIGFSYGYGTLGVSVHNNSFVAVIAPHVVAAIASVIASIFLIGVSSNRIVRTMTVVYLIVTVLSDFDTIAIYYALWANSNSVATDNPVLQWISSPVAKQILGIFSYIICPVVLVYVFSVILKSDALGNGDKAWIAIIPIVFIYSLCMTMARLTIPTEMLGYNFFEMSPFRYEQYSFRWLRGLLEMIAYIKLCISPLFAGNYDDSPAPKGSYSPFNKCILSLVVTVGVVAGAFFVYYRFVVPLLADF